MKQKPFFSIIIPTLNEEKYLPSLLEDLASQTMLSFEVIVVDGQSSDKTIKLANDYQKSLPKLTILVSPQKNVSIQRNLGAKHASGKWLIFNDADNRLPNYFLEGVKYQVTANPTDLFTCWSTTEETTPKDKTIAQACNLLLEASLLTKSPSAFGAMIGCKKNIFDTSTGFNPKIGFAEDKDFVLNYYKAGHRFRIFKDPKYVYSLRRFHSEGTLNLIQKSSKLLLKYLSGQNINQEQEYPMGGLSLKNNDKTSIIFKINQLLNTPIKTPKIIEKLKSIILIED